MSGGKIYKPSASVDSKHKRAMPCSAYQKQQTTIFRQRMAEAQAKGVTLSVVKKTGRNAPCPCGSGVKFKKCCLGAMP